MSQAIAPTEIIAKLLEIGAIKINTQEFFTFASGIKSPVYMDCRLILGHHDFRRQLAEIFAKIIQEKYPRVDLISGVATGSIAMAAWVADILQKPLIYWRKPKGYGQNKTVEGVFKPGQKVVIIEDVISTGGNSLQAVNDLRENGLEVSEVLAIYSYKMTSSENNYREKQASYSSLADFDDLINFLKNSSDFQPEQIQIMESWKSSLV